MPLIERKENSAIKTIRQHDERRVREAELKVGITFPRALGHSNIVGAEWDQLICALDNVVENYHCNSLAGDTGDQVVNLGQDKWGK
jgi:hypothetical protein